MNSTELFYLAMAALGGYAAWQTIQKNKAQQQAASDWLLQGAFNNGVLDYYGQTTATPSYNEPSRVFDYFKGNYGVNKGYA